MARILEDLCRVARGVALVAAKGIADSPIVKGLARGDVERRLRAAAAQGQQLAKAAQEAGQHAVRQGAAAVPGSAQEAAQAAQGAAQGAAEALQQAAQRVQQTVEPQLREALGRATTQGATFKDTAEAAVRRGEAELRNAAETAQQQARGAVDATAQQAHMAADNLQRSAETGARRAAAARAQSAAAAAQSAPASAQPTAATSSSGLAFAPWAARHGGTLVPASAHLAEVSMDPGFAAARVARQTPAAHPAAAAPRAQSQPPPPSPPAGSSGAEGSLSAAAADPVEEMQRAQAAAAASRSSGQDVEQARSGALASTFLRSGSGDGAAAMDGAAEGFADTMQPSGAAGEAPAAPAAAVAQPAASKPQAERRKLRQRRVPSSQLGRVMGFAGLGARLAAGTAVDSITSMFRPKQENAPAHSMVLSEANAERLANALCRMRGAALKLGQMLSIQDDNVLPPAFQAALDRVRAGADTMPRRQLEKAISSELGPDWRSKVAEFDEEPLAAASIGQVHAARLHDGREVVMKIQYPGVARSIESDVENLLRLINTFNLLPEGLYARQAAEVAKEELALECDYKYEAACQQRFKALVEAEPAFAGKFSVPAVVPELCAARLLTTERVPGVPIDQVRHLAPEVRNRVGTRLLQLTLHELFHWKFMQTDPNFGNFLYDEGSDMLHLIDFGASRDFPSDFVMNYMEMVRACADKDRDEVIARSLRLGFLTGDESSTMLDAHTQAGFLVGVPFAHEGDYDFTLHGDMTRRVGNLGAVMVKERLTAPPREAYSLHRKLSGAFLANIKLGAVVPCRRLFLDTYNSVKAGEAAAAAGAGAEPAATAAAV